jgi:hypothetical protein
LEWVEDECALQVSDREHGRRHRDKTNCFRGITVQIDAPDNVQYRPAQQRITQ